MDGSSSQDDLLTRIYGSDFSGLLRRKDSADGSLLLEKDFAHVMRWEEMIVRTLLQDTVVMRCASI